MSGYEEILKTSEDGKYRLKLILDECANEPYDDGQSPLLRIDRGGYESWDAVHVMATGRPTDDDDRIEAAARKWGSPSSDDFGRYFVKYLKAFYGTREVETWWSGSYWYVTYDTDSWRKYIGFEPNAKLPDHPLVNMDEYRAWCLGECWGYVIEENVTWQRSDDPGTTTETWEEVPDGSCWGFYGDYGREAAKTEFTAFLANLPEPKPEPSAWAERLRLSSWQRFIVQLRQIRRSS